MPFDWHQLVELAPLIGGALHPGSPEAAAMMRGYQRSQQQRRLDTRQQGQDTRAQQYQDAQIANLNADNQRGEAQLALDRLSKYRGEGQHVLSAIAEKPEAVLPPGTDPLQAQNNLVVQNFQAQQAYGVPPGTPQGPLPDMAAGVKKGKQKRAQQIYDTATKQFGEEAMASDSVTIQTEEFGPIKPSGLRSLFAPQGVDAMGAPAKPYVKPVNNPKNYQSKDMMRGGKRVTVNFDPDTGAYTDLAGQSVTDIEPIPPVSLQQQGSGLSPRAQSRVDAKAKGFDAQPVVKTTQKVAEAVSFVNSLDPNSKNPADDQALIYAFAKAMDPDSVVREGEYNTVQKYSQSWAQTFGFNAARVLSNSEFLSPETRANLKSTILKKYAAAKGQYDNIRRSYASQIDRITGQPGTGDDWLVDYGGAFPSTGETPSKPPKNPFRD